MGLKDWGQQGSGFPSDTYAPAVSTPWMSILANEDGSTGAATFADFDNFHQDLAAHPDAATFNVFDLVYAASTQVGGSPFAAVTAYNPDSIISDISDSLEELRQAIDDYDTDTLDDAVTESVTQVATLLGDDVIADLVALKALRQDTAHNHDVSNLYAGLWEAGAIIGAQTFAAAAMMRNERNRETNEYEMQLQVNRQQLRAQLAANLTSMAVQIGFQKMQVRQALVGSELDYMRFVTTAKQDQQDKDLEYMLRDVTWDLDLIPHVTNALGAIYGAQTNPRSQTKGERLLAALNGSISLGIQGGMALGSPQGGFALGGFNFLSQLLLTPQ